MNVSAGDHDLLLKDMAASRPPPLAVGLDLLHGFGCSPSSSNVVQSFQVPKTSLKDENTDRIVYKMGRRICIYDATLEKITFLASPQRAVVEIHHFHIAFSGRYVSLCESARHEKDGEIRPQLSVYSLSTLQRLNTCCYESEGKFICSSFCSDNKYVVVLCIEDQQHVTILWNWEKEKLHKILSFPSSLKLHLVCCPPSFDALYTVSGPLTLKLCYVGIDGSMRSNSLVPISKERSERVIDHIWLNPHGNVQKLAILVEFESSDPQKKLFVYIFESTAESTFRENDQVHSTFELRQTLPIFGAGVHTLKPRCVMRSSRGFIVGGDRGFISLFEKTDDKKTAYQESLSLRIGDEENVVSGTLLPMEDRLIVYSDRTSRLISIPISLLNLKEKGVQHPTQMPTDLTLNGFHADHVVAADIAFHRSLLVTISADCTARVWNYISRRCEVVQQFGAEDPRAVAIHTNGLQVLISFKDCVRLYNILRNNLKVYKETIVRSCQDLKFSSGCQFWAAASGLSVLVFDTKTFVQMMSFPGHLNPVNKLVWAPGDQVKELLTILDSV